MNGRSRAALVLVAIAVAVLDEVGSPLGAWLIGVDLLAGGAFVASGIFASSARSKALFAISAYGAGLIWFLANRVEVLLFAWRPAMVLAALSMQRRGLDGVDRWVVAAFVVAAAVPQTSTEPRVTLGLSALLLFAATRRERRALTRSRWADIPLPALAVAMAVPAIGLTRDLPASTSSAFTLVNSVTVAIAGLSMLATVVHELDSPTRAADFVIDLSRGATGTSPRLADLVQTPVLGDVHDPDVRVAIDVAVLMLADNQQLQTALENQVSEVQASRVRLLEAADIERMRVGQRLDRDVRPLLDDMDEQLRRLLCMGAPGLAEDLDRCVDELLETRADLERLAIGMHPRTLVDRGLWHALNELASRFLIDVEVVCPRGRFDGVVETPIWYACAECVANVGKYAGATRARIVVTESDRGLDFCVTDDGGGGARIVPGGGLSGLEDRLSAVAGGFMIESDESGTRVAGWVPWPDR